MKKEYEWLPELNGTIPNEAFGYAVSVYQSHMKHGEEA